MNKGFDIDLAQRTVTHRFTGTVFTFYAYSTEQDWAAATDCIIRKTDKSPLIIWPLAAEAKAEALAAGMKAS